MANMFIFYCFQNPFYDTAKDLDADCAKIFISKLRSGRPDLQSIIIILTFAPFMVYKFTLGKSIYESGFIQLHILAQPHTPILYHSIFKASLILGSSLLIASLLLFL